MATSTNGATGAQRWKEMSKPEVGDWRVKGGLAQMLKGGVIMDVVTPDQAKIAEDAGAVSVMALERVPSDIRRDGGVARMSDPDLISGIIDAVSIPVMAKARIGHFVPADNAYHIDKWQYKMPYVCGARNIGEALRRIGEGAAMIRTKGEAGTGDIVHAVTHARQILADIRTIQHAPTEELMSMARDFQAPYELVVEVARTGKLPVVNFAAGGIATPADAALLMQIGVEGVFVGSGIFKSDNPAKMADAIVRATTHFNDPDMLAEISRGLGDAMSGIEANKIPEDQQLQTRGW